MHFRVIIDKKEFEEETEDLFLNQGLEIQSIKTDCPQKGQATIFFQFMKNGETVNLRMFVEMSELVQTIADTQDEKPFICEVEVEG